MSWMRILVTFLALFMVLAYVSVRAQDAPHIGIKIRTLTPQLRKEHKLPEDTRGALVTAINPDSPAKEKGIVPGDVIVEAAGKPVAAAKDVASRIASASASGNDAIVLHVMNEKGEHREVTVPIPKRPAQGSKSLLPAPK